MASRGDIVPGADQPATQAHQPLLRHPCPICIERLEYDKLCIVECGHFFCHDCIVALLEHQQRVQPVTAAAGDDDDDDDDDATPAVVWCPVCRVVAPFYCVPRDDAGEPYDPRRAPGAFDPFVLAACEQEAADEQEEQTRPVEELETAHPRAALRDENQLARQEQQQEETLAAVDAADDDDDDGDFFVTDRILAYHARTDSCTVRWRGVGGRILETQERMPGLVAAARLIAGGEGWTLEDRGAAELGP